MPKGVDGVSLAPTLLGRPRDQRPHEYLYWEFFGYGGQQAVRLGDWKAVRQNLHKGQVRTELYDLKADAGESRDVAAEHPEVVKRIEAIMRSAHAPSALFPIKALDGK